MAKKKFDRAIDILEAGPDKNFSVKLNGQPEKFFVTAQRLAEYVEQMKPSEWREDMAVLKAIEDGKFKPSGYRLPSSEDSHLDEESKIKLKQKFGEVGSVTYESKKQKNVKARENFESEGV